MKIVIKGNVKEKIEVEGWKDKNSTRDEVIDMLKIWEILFVNIYHLHVFHTQDTNEGAKIIYVDHI